jgi:hypothetical protein
MYAASIAAEHGAHELYRSVAVALPPGALLGTTLVWRISPHIETIRLVLALSGTITALLSYRVARTLFDLSPPAALLAAVLALTGPIHAQFVGLEGESIITPLALALALSLERKQLGVCVALLASGFFFKLTWIPFFLAGVFGVASWLGWRRAFAAGACALVGAATLYAVALESFSWSVRDLSSQLLFAQAHSGLQLELLPGLVLAVIVVWWPFLALAAAGLTVAAPSARLMMIAGGLSSLYMVKEGTFFNVLDPLEPFVVIAAVAGGLALWRQRRALVAVCALGALVHVASVGSGALRSALPVPVGAAIVNTDNESKVDRIARVVAAHSRPGQAVLVNPLFALVAHREEPAAAADWFILHALDSYCAGRRSGRDHCGDWRKIKALARAGGTPVISVDSNIVSFDSHFSRDTGVEHREPSLKIKAPPITTKIYVRP